MLQEKLAKANQVVARRQAFLLMIVTVLGLLVILVFLVPGLFSQGNPESTVPAPVAGIPDAMPETAPETEERDAFKERLRIYDTTLAPQTAEPGFAAWSTTRKAQLEAQRQAAIDDFSLGAYGPAIRKTEALYEQTAEALLAWEAAFTDTKARARKALAQDNHAQALTAISQSLRLRPGDEQALALKERIDALPAIMDALKRVRIARAEADPEAEIAALGEILEQDPQRTDMAERHAQLSGMLREKKYTASIQRGLSHAEKGEARQARKYLDRVLKTHAGREETRLLGQKVVFLEKSLARRNFLATAMRQQQKDQWQAALDAYRQALLIDPGDTTALQGQAVAQNVMATRAEIRGYMDNPYRLSSPNVAALARKALERAGTFGELSPSLAASGRALSKLVDLHNTPVPVRVLSDGETAIVVQGVGRVGQIQEKTISLKPGKYTLKGLRTGYVSKMVTLDVPVNSGMSGNPVVEVTVICDTRI